MYYLDGAGRPGVRLARPRAPAVRRRRSRAIAAQAVWSSVLAATGTYRQLFTRVIYTEWLFFALMAAGLFVLRRRAGYRPAYRTPGAIRSCRSSSSSASLAIVINQIYRTPVGGGRWASALVALGAPVYYLRPCAIVDFHNHYYPPEYLERVDGSGVGVAVKVTYDDDGQPVRALSGRLQHPRARPSRIDYRQGVLDEHGVDTQVITFTTPGVHVEAPATAVELARARSTTRSRASCASAQARFAALATLPLNDPAASVTRARARDDGARAAGRDGVQQRQRRGARRRAVRAAVEEGQRARRRHLHPPDRSRSASRRWWSTG